ncbi:hypothetical protein GCM10008929_13120 [Alkalibacterium psychrotolerans]
MIYNKDAAFSYPVLTNSNNSYINSGFDFSINNIIDNSDTYELTLQYDIESSFVRSLIENKLATLILIVQSDDNLFFELDNNQKVVSIAKSRITFKEKVRAQVHIQSKEKILFDTCTELNQFYSSIKNRISISQNCLVGYSNVSTIRNTGREGVALFEKTVDPKMDMEFSVQLSNKSIILKFKEDRHLLKTTARSRDIMNIYLYNGLQRALNQFVSENVEDDEEGLYLEDIDDTSLNDLHYKIYQLLNRRGVIEISYDDIDKLVQKLAPNIIDKFTYSIERLNENGI